MARAFSRPEEESYLEALMQQFTRWGSAWADSSESLRMPFETQSVLREVTNMLRYFDGEVKDHSLLALEIVYNRLFYGPGKPLVPPYASAYIYPQGQLVMAQPAMDALKLYRKEGLEIAENFYDLPDHLILELEFMSFLCEQEVSADLPKKWWEKQYQFLIYHLLWWLPAFVDSLQESAEPLYPSLAGLLLRWIKADLGYLGVLLNEYSSPSLGQRKKVRLQIKGDCSFCGICSLRCQDDALALVLEEKGVELHFYPERCSGCSICVETCPMKILYISRGSSPRNNQGTSAEILAKGPCMRCKDCGCIIPFPGHAYVLHQLKPEVKGDLLLFLQLCEACRAQKLVPRLASARGAANR
jgi:TorA maturation chaperone TorD/Pyruvate/2-oxoacid:ferredoxin oxidoreductase delta subunit